jgi:hypothetical protein
MKVLKMEPCLDEILPFLLQKDKQYNNEEVFLMLFYILEEEYKLNPSEGVLNVKEYLYKFEIEKIKKIKLFFDVEKISALPEYQKVYLSKQKNIDWIDLAKIFFEKNCIDIYVYTSSNGSKKLNKIIFYKFKIIEKIDVKKISENPSDFNILIKEMFSDYNLFSEGVNLFFNNPYVNYIPFKFTINMHKKFEDVNMNVFKLMEIDNIYYNCIFNHFKNFECEQEVDIMPIFSTTPEFLNYRMMLFILFIFNTQEFLNLIKNLLYEMKLQKLKIEKNLNFFYDLFRSFLTYFKNIKEKEEYENLLMKNVKDILFEDYFENIFSASIHELVEILYEKYFGNFNSSLFKLPFLKTILEDSSTNSKNSISTGKCENNNLDLFFEKTKNLTSTLNEFLISLLDINSNICLKIFEENSEKYLDNEFKKELKFNFYKENTSLFKDVNKTFGKFKFIEDKIKMIQFEFVRYKNKNTLKESNLNLEIEKIKKENSEKLSQNILNSLNNLKDGTTVENSEKMKFFIPYYFDNETKSYKDSIFDSNLISYIENFYSKYIIILKATFPLGSTPIGIYPELFSKENFADDEKSISFDNDNDQESKLELKSLLDKSYEYFLSHVGNEKEKFKFNLFLKMKLKEESEVEKLIFSEFPHLNLNDYFLKKFKIFLQDFSNCELKTLEEFIYSYFYSNEIKEIQNFYKNEISFSDLFFSNKKYDDFLYDMQLKVDFYKNLLIFNFLDKSKNVNLEIDYNFLDLFIQNVVENNIEAIIQNFKSPAKEMVEIKNFINLFETKNDTRKKLNHDKEEENKINFKNFNLKNSLQEKIKKELYYGRNSMSYLLKYVIDRGLYYIKKIRPETKLLFKVNFEESKINSEENDSLTTDVEINPKNFTNLSDSLVKLIKLNFVESKLEKTEDNDNSESILTVEVLLTLGINKFKSPNSELENDFIYYLLTDQLNIEHTSIKKDFIPNSDYDILIKDTCDDFTKKLEEILKK